MKRVRSEIEIVRGATKIGNPIRPTIGYVSSVVAATRSGGCGFWYGLGMVHTALNCQECPGGGDPSWVHALRRVSRGSREGARLPPLGVVDPREWPGTPLRPVPHPSRALLTSAPRA